MFQTNLLWQNDANWASYPLGSGPNTIKDWGCLMTCLTMVVNGYGHTETPKTFNDKMMSGGGFQGQFVNAFVVGNIFPGIQTLSYDECESSPAPIAKIDAALAKGDPVVVQVDQSPNAGVQSHWVIAYAKEGNDYLIYDPYQYSGDAPGKKLKLLSRYEHQGDDLAQAISAALFMTGTKGQQSSAPPTASSSGSTAAPPAPAPAPAPAQKVPVPADSYTVYASTDDLAFRSAPSVGGALLKRVPDQTAFKTLEKKSNADAKVGQYNQWLHVQDTTGAQGYVAAWYVAKAKGGTQTAAATVSAPAGGNSLGAAPLTPAAASAGGLVLTPTTDGLALRSAAQLSAGLIKRLPFTSKLKVLEPAAGARAKLGVTNQWVHVQDITGKQGYVAAWYVTEAAAPALGVKAATGDDEGGTPDASDDVVRTLVDQVALRKQPVISGATLLQRLPLRAELVLLNPAEKSKIGKVGQWLHVREVGGAQGYVAAWYVKD